MRTEPVRHEPEILGSRNSLSIDEQKIVQSCFDATVAALHAIGLEATFSTAMADWASMMRNAPRIMLVNPTFDPAHNDLTPDNAFWIKLSQIADGRSVACIANRLFVTDDYVDLLRTQRVWYSRGPRRMVDLVVPADMPRIAGRVGHHAGLWVRPDWRKHGLSGYMTRLARCASLRRFDVDWHCGLVFAAIAEKGLPTEMVAGYGYPRMVLAIDGWQPLTDEPDRLYLPWISRAEMLAHLAGETRRLGRPVGDRDQETVRLPAVS
ncbi:MAG TPA: hypothetical protein VMB81_11335 [Candidatus Sulfotelmatobacter sp.]|nr:hypothetical protein [Candidatus Sulfotelmatobacter sp.]